MNKEKVGEVKADGKETLVEKRYCAVEEIKVNQESIERLKEGKELESSYLGKVVIPGTLFKVELPILYNEDNDYIYVILAGENKEGYCNLKVNTPGEGGKNETKAIKDIKTASIQVFCEYTNLPAPERSNNSSGSCDSCKHKRKVKVTEKDGQVVKHSVCGLDGLIVDKDWHDLKQFVEAKNTGLVGKKEKSTITYEHADESPYLSARKGRYRNTDTMRLKYTGEGANCPYYGAWFHIAKEDKWVTHRSKELPWKENKVIGSEVIIDADKFIERKDKTKLQILLEKLNFSYGVLEKLANCGEDKEVLVETIKLLTEKELDKKEMELLLEEIMDMRN